MVLLPGDTKTEQMDPELSKSVPKGIKGDVKGAKVSQGTFEKSSGEQDRKSEETRS